MAPVRPVLHIITIISFVFSPDIRSPLIVSQFLPPITTHEDSTENQSVGTFCEGRERKEECGMRNAE